MKYIAQIQKSEQVTEDSWKLHTYTLEVDRETTVGEVEDWVLKVRQINEARRPHFNLEVTISQVDEKPVNP
jgi:hypothetical protein